MTTKIHDVKKQGDQGDVRFTRVDKVPNGYEPQKNDGPIIVAHSETGHHHTVPGLDAVLYAKRDDKMTSYLVLGDVQGLEVTHHRPHDTHDTLRLLGGKGAVWRVRRQREHTPEGWRQVQD